MVGWWAQAGMWLRRGLPSRLNKTMPPAATACFFGGSFTHAHTRVAVGAIFRRPVDRAAVATPTQRHMHSLSTQPDRLANCLRASAPIIQSLSVSTCVDRSSSPLVKANTVAAASPLATRQLQPIRYLASQTPGHRPIYSCVRWHNHLRQWTANIGVIDFTVGCFDSEVSAARHSDVAIRYLVQCKVLDEKYLERTNVDRGVLEPFEPTAEETERVVKWWRERVEREEQASVFRGVYRNNVNSAGESGREWLAEFTDEIGKSHHIGLFLTEVEAACAVDEAVRAAKLPLSKKLRMINFYREKDYLTEYKARKITCIGVFLARPKKTTTHPFHVYANTRLCNSERRFRTHVRYVGCYATHLEGIDAHDRFVLDQWAQQDEPRGPLPPTYFNPTNYGYDLISSPVIPPLNEETMPSSS